MTGVAGANPPNDSGSQTFARYCYQAKVAFPYVLVCAAGSQVTSVYLEHFEDIAIEASSQWDFLQVKSRQLSQGPWRLSDVLGQDGAFRSLLRTYRALRGGRLLGDTRLVACLEGAVKVGDDLELFVGNPCGRDDVIARLSSRLDLAGEEVGDFIPRLRVRPEQPITAIDAVNIRRLGTLMATSRHTEIEAMYASVLGLIQSAMEAALLSEDWALRVFDHATPGAPAPSEPKRLDRTRLEGLSSAIAVRQRPLLGRLLSPERRPASQLEEKLLLAGASTAVVDSALEMRAVADRWLVAQQAASLWPDDDVAEDLDIRLRTLAAAVVAGTHGDPAPANRAWAQLHARLTAEAESHDPDRVFGQDALLLLGRICSLSDQCVIAWATTNA
jgi:Cap4, dsDNA endonuclease domain